MRIFSVDFRRSINDLYGATATLGSTATVQNDTRGMALKCKSLATDYITYGDITAIDAIGTGAFSFVVGANVKGFLAHGYANNTLSGKTNNSGATGFSLYYNDTATIIIKILSSVISFATTFVAKNNLYILTRNASGLCTLYLNGISVGTPVTQSGSISNAALMSVGYDGETTGRTPNASIYLSEVYNHCLTQQEIDNLVRDFNKRTIVSKPQRGFIQNRATDLSFLKPSLIAVYNFKIQ